MTEAQRQEKRKWRLVYGLAVLVGLMVGLTYASVPLYDLFCRTTGFGGTPQQTATAPPPDQIKERTVLVTFNADVNGAMPWDFKPEVQSMRVRLGETKLIHYQARNNGSVPIVGTSTYNVQPDRAGPFFNKIQCFCFAEQRLEPGQSMSFPVEFFVDPSLVDDPKYNDVTEITLSYTFFMAKDQGKTAKRSP